MAVSYSKFTYEDLNALRISAQTEALHLETSSLVQPSAWLKETLELNMQLPLASEKQNRKVLLPLFCAILCAAIILVSPIFQGTIF